MKTKLVSYCIVRLPGFLSPPQLLFYQLPLLKELSSETLKHIQEEVHVCNGTLYLHLGNPKTNHTAFSPLLPKSVYIPTKHEKKARIEFVIKDGNK